MPVRLSMTVNGKPVSADVESRMLLVDFIRDTLRLTGTHIGCDTAQCGACTIHMNGVAVNGIRRQRTVLDDGDIVELGHTLCLFRASGGRDDQDASPT